MSAYTIRFFSLTPLYSVARLQVWLVEQGYDVRPAGTNVLDVAPDEDSLPVRVELTTAQADITQREIVAFIEAVERLSDPNAAAVMDALARTQAIVALRVLEGCDALLLADILEGCAALAQGLVQVDGEGFYENGELILEVG